MNRPSVHLVLPILLGLAPLARADGAPGGDTDARLRAMETRIAQQDQEIQRLRNQQAPDGLDAVRAEQVRQLVREVLADADTRASLLEGGVNAGFKNGHFFLGSEDGTFGLQISGLIQFRYIADFRRGAATPTPADNSESGFQLARVKLDFQGNIGSPNLLYRVRLAAYRDTGAVYVDTATIGYKAADNLTLLAGRFKEPFTREDIISDTYQLTVDRSIANTIFSAKYVEGVLAEWQPADWVKLAGTVTDGARSGTAPLDSGNGLIPATVGMDFQNDNTDVALSGRFDAKILGDWKQYGDFSSWSGASGPALFVGGGIHYQVAETGDTAPNSNFLLWTADATYKSGPLSVFVAGYGHDDTKRPTGGKHFDDYAFLIQAGYFVVPDRLEPFARFEYIVLDGKRSGSTDPISAVTAGVNWYFFKQSAKLTADVVWVFDPLSSNSNGGTGLTSQGLLPDANGKENQVSIRAQLQLLF